MTCLSLRDRDVVNDWSADVCRGVHIQHHDPTWRAGNITPYDRAAQHQFQRYRMAVDKRLRELGQKTLFT